MKKPEIKVNDMTVARNAADPDQFSMLIGLTDGTMILSTFRASGGLSQVAERLNHVSLVLDAKRIQEDMEADGQAALIVHVVGEELYKGGAV